MRALAQFHALAGVALLVVVALFTVLAAALAFRLGYAGWLGRARQAVTVLLGLQLVVGMATFSAGYRPDDQLHLLYSLVAFGILPAAERFASEAPPKPRAAVLAIGGLLTLGVTWRLTGTG